MQVRNIGTPGSSGININELQRRLEYRYAANNNKSDEDEDSDSVSGCSTTSRRNISDDSNSSSDESESDTIFSNKQGRKSDPIIDFNRLGYTLKMKLNTVSDAIRNRLSRFMSTITENMPFVDTSSSDIPDSISSLSSSSSEADSISSTISDDDTTSISSSSSFTSSNFDSVSSASSRLADKPPVYTQEDIQYIADSAVKNLSNGSYSLTGGISFIGGENVGGHGDVLFLEHINIVLKKNLSEQEANSYKFLNQVCQWLQEDNPSLSSVPEQLQGVPRSDLKYMLDKKELLLKHLPMPIAMASGSDSTVIAIRNVNQFREKDGTFKEISSTGVVDVKIGSRTMSMEELKVHQPEKVRGFERIRKLFSNYLLPALRGTHDRGYEVVPQKKGIGRLMAAKAESEELLGVLNKQLTPEQSASLVQQIFDLSEAMLALPVTFVGSSLLMALPNSDTPNIMPQVSMVDFAHPIFHNETDAKGPLKEKTYYKYRQFYMDGIVGLRYQLKKLADYKYMFRNNN